MDSGEGFCGTIVVDIPLDPQISSVDDTVTFSQQPRKFSNLGDCEHFKIQGTAYRPSNNGPITPPRRKSVFGQSYNQEGVGQDIIARTTGSYESWPRLYGNFSNNQKGYWRFGIAAERVGNLVYSAIGFPDLEKSWRYDGYYQFYLYEFRSVGKKVQYRQCTITWSTPRTSLVRPLEALKDYKESLSSLIRSQSWMNWNQVNSLLPVSTNDLYFPSYQAIFPATDMSVRWGELAADAYNSVPFFSSNGIAYTNDLINLKKSASTTLSLIKSLGTTGKAASKIASLFLSYYYGWRLFVKDTQELYGSIGKRSNSSNYFNRATSQRSWSAHGANYLATFQCYYNRYAHASSLDQFVLDNDLALTPENLWDLVPFSFVVDWFTGIGGALEDASNYYTFVQKHEVLCTGRSIKATRSIDAGKLHNGWCGTLTCSYYRRLYTSGAYNPTFHFSNSVNPLDHAIEGTALIVSRR